MNALTNKQREAIRTWLDSESAPFNSLELPVETPLSESTPETSCLGCRIFRVTRQRVAYRSGWWQYYAEGEGAEPLMFGRMRREPVKPYIRPSVKDQAHRLDLDRFSPEEAEYLKDVVTLRTLR